MKEKECGFIISQKVTPSMTKAKLAKKFNSALKRQKKDLMKKLELPKDKIHTGCYYDPDGKEYKGIVEIQAECSYHCINDQGIEAVFLWLTEDEEPFTIVPFVNY